MLRGDNNVGSVEVAGEERVMTEKGERTEIMSNFGRKEKIHE